MRQGKGSSNTPSGGLSLRDGADLVQDAALELASEDRFDHAAIAGVIAKLVTGATPPVNIALFGPWGSGKSSFFGLLRERLLDESTKVVTARYDAWKYGGRALKKHFVGSIGKQIGLESDDLDRSLARDQERLKLDLASWLRTNARSLLLGAFLSVGVAAAWFFLVSFAGFLIKQSDGFGRSMQLTVTSVGTVLSLSFAALLFGPKVLESAVVKVTEAAPETDDEFARSFEKLVQEKIAVKSGERLVVFIDELDRCSPEDVVSTLVDLKTFLGLDGCVFVVAADREVLERSLQAVAQANPVRDEDPYYSTPGAFLDKIFQHQIPLPPLRPQTLTRFARDLVAQQTGLWSELRDADEDERLFLRVVYALVPVHVRSPRRVKVLLNNFATRVRIAEARGIDWVLRSEELATLTVLETEFPSVVADLVKYPALLQHLRRRDSEPAPSGSAALIVANYLGALESASAQDEGPTESVAGTLLVDQHGDRVLARRASKTLVDNLLAYLRRIDASGIDDPKPDLLFLQSAGYFEGLHDPELAETLDLASDLSADDVLTKFAFANSATKAIAVRLLAQQADAERGPGRLSMMESVCRLSEELDPVDLQAVAPVVAGTVLADADSSDWPMNATPGALMLGVIGARKDLVDALLAQQDAEEMAESGLLGRLWGVLQYGTPDQVALVHDLLGSAYIKHPQPLHDALRYSEPAAALSLWSASSQLIADAFLAAHEAQTAAASSSATVSTSQSETGLDSVDARFGQLLDAVEYRSDDNASELISSVILLGQKSGIRNVRAAANERFRSLVDRIRDPRAQNEHALLGLKFAPVPEAAWWAGLLTDGAASSTALTACGRLLGALSTSAIDELPEISTALIRASAFVEVSSLAALVLRIRDVLADLGWSSEAAASNGNRASLHRFAESLRGRLPELESSRLNAILAADLRAGLDHASEDDVMTRLLALVRTASKPTAKELFDGLSGRDDPLPAACAAFRMRAAALQTGADGSLEHTELLELKGASSQKEAFSEWLALEPPLAEATQVLGKITVYINALDRYASTLSSDDREALWLFLARDDNGSWSKSAFQSVAKHGVASSVVEHAAGEIRAATKQEQRNYWIDLLCDSRLVESPPHKQATALVLYLLGTGVGGDIPLAARLAVRSGGAAYGRLGEVRLAFDKAEMERPKALSENQKRQLRTIKLLSKPSKKSKRILSRVLGS